MKKSNIFNIMAKVQSLPSIPGAAVKLLRMLEDVNTSAQDIENVLRYEPGLTANIIKMANSAYFGLRVKIGSIKQAVVILGLKQIRKLLVTSCMNSIMDKPIPGYDLDSGELWRHSVAVSVAAEELCKELNVPEQENIFTAALLHDIGKLVLASFVDKDLSKIELEAAKGIDFTSAEQIILGTDHAEAGSFILKNWSFPAGITNAVRWHHEPDKADKCENSVDIVHIANIMCLMIGIGSGRTGLQQTLSSSSVERLHLSHKTFEKVASQTLEYANELAIIF